MSSVATLAGALLYLRVTSLVGRVRSRLRRLKQPKYMAGALVGAAYLYLAFIRRSLGPHHGYGPGPAGPGVPLAALSVLPGLAAVVLLVVLIVNWATPRNAALAFSEAEIAFLFPAPVNRRLLVHYRLLGSQIGIVFTALILTLVFGRGRGLGGNPWFHAIGWWLILATVNLHFTGTSFLYSKLLNRSLTAGWAKAAVIAAVWLLAATLMVWIWAAVQLPQHADLVGAREFMGYLAAQLRAGPLPWLLAIPGWVVAPYFATGGAAFVLALGPALGVLAAHYLWVVHTEVAFEEATIARARRRAARVQAVRQGDWRGQGAAPKAQRAPFALRERGRPEVAFLWKNLLSTSAVFRPQAMLAVLVIALLGSQWLVRQPELAGVRLFAVLLLGIALGMTLLLGPMLARQDLRADLRNVELLKTYPLRGWQIVLGELLTPLLILSGVTWVCLVMGSVLLPQDKLPWLNPSLRGAATFGLAILAPPFVAIQLLVPNAAAVIFPAWTQAAGNRAERGIEVMGQRIIFVAGQLLITAIAIIPAALSAALVFLIAQWLIGMTAAAGLAALAVFALLSVEAGLGVLWLGSRFENFDPGTELQP